VVWRQSNTPFLVESFEPHADYMLESGVWKRFDLRFIFQKRWEQKQKKYALGLMPVAENYRRKLIEEGVPEEKIRTAPCSVSLTMFGFDWEKRQKMRASLTLAGDTTVGIYAGKFGGLYLEGEAFKLYKAAFRFFPNFHLVILTPTELHEWVFQQIEESDLPRTKISVKSVNHDQVPDYLSMSDFAYGTYKPGSNTAYLSPVKIGEYWANGLPVVLTAGVGDESAIIEGKAGVLFSMNDIYMANMENIYKKLKNLLSKNNLRHEISALASVYRGEERTHDAYRHFLLQLKYDSKRVDL
jgi:glycosyltransferase involved in cell wall biosynthesis